MPIERQAITPPKKRTTDELSYKAERIGSLLGLSKVAVHTLAWKEQRLPLSSGDCYPLYDVLERMAVMLSEEASTPEPKKPGRHPKK